MTTLRWLPPDQPGPTIILTPRQAHLLTRVHRGMTNAEIAADLGIGLETVKTTMRRLRTAADARDRAHLVAVTCGRAVLVRVSERWAS